MAELAHQDAPVIAIQNVIRSVVELLCRSVHQQFHPDILHVHNTQDVELLVSQAALKAVVNKTLINR